MPIHLRPLQLPEGETQMPILVRERTEGKHELRVTHALLPKPFYKTFDDPDEAQRVGKRAIIELQKGKVPAWLVREKPAGTTTTIAAVRSARSLQVLLLRRGIHMSRALRGAE